jgi:DNA-directed RNA polymerase subunit L
MSKFFDFGEVPEKQVVIKSPVKVENSRVPESFNREKVFNTPGYTFTYGGTLYECIGEDKDFQITQFRFCIEIQDWVTIKNRIRNQLLFGPNIKEMFMK